VSIHKRKQIAATFNDLIVFEMETIDKREFVEYGANRIRTILCPLFINLLYPQHIIHKG